MNFQPLPDRWTDDAGWLAQAIDPHNRLMRLVRMDEAAYRAASFLDDRMLQPGLESRICALDEAMGRWPRDCRVTTRAGYSTSAMSARRWSRGCWASWRTSCRSASRVRCATSAVAGEEGRPAMAIRLEAAHVAHLPVRSSPRWSRRPASCPNWPRCWSRRGLRHCSSTRPLPTISPRILAGENSVKELAALHAPAATAFESRGIGLTGFDQQRCPSRGAGLGMRNDFARSGRGDDGRPPHLLGGLRSDAWRHGGLDWALCRRIWLRGARRPDRRDRRRTIDAPLFQGAGI